MPPCVKPARLRRKGGSAPPLPQLVIGLPACASDPSAEEEARTRGLIEGNPQRNRSQLVGILRKIPEEGLSAAAQGILFPELKVRRSRGA